MVRRSAAIWPVSAASWIVDRRVLGLGGSSSRMIRWISVSYTHLTLPTIYSV